MSIGTILLILLIIFLIGGFSGRFGGYGYGFGNGGIGVLGVLVIVIVVLMLMGRIWAFKVQTSLRRCGQWQVSYLGHSASRRYGCQRMKALLARRSLQCSDWD